jgi:hypothetical protein
MKGMLRRLPGGPELKSIILSTLISKNKITAFMPITGIRLKKMRTCGTKTLHSARLMGLEWTALDSVGEYAL